MGGGCDIEEGRNAGLNAAQSVVLRFVGILLPSARMIAQEGSLWSVLGSIG